LEWLIDNHFLPAYFSDIPGRVTAISKESSGFPPETGQGHKALHPKKGNNAGTPKAADHSRLQVIGGGTDLMVQRPYELAEAEPLLVSDIAIMKGISQENDHVVIGASATATDIMESPVMQGLFPRIRQYFKLIASNPIRNMGTLAGNLVNASPIGDLSIFFLALDARIETAFMGGGGSSGQSRHIALKDFFLGYKQLDLKPGEVVVKLIFNVPDEPVYFSFEKVSKRTHLDIAGVNGAMLAEVKGGMITRCHASCGGVAPVPLYLKETCQFLAGKPLLAATLVAANKVLQQEITPISDVRGTAVYKRLLARQLFYAHFIRLFPTHIRFSETIPKTSP
jgi:xanthine dehydrogenase small subunit